MLKLTTKTHWVCDKHSSGLNNLSSHSWHHLIGYTFQTNLANLTPPNNKAVILDVNCKWKVVYCHLPFFRFSVPLSLPFRSHAFVFLPLREDEPQPQLFLFQFSDKWLFHPFCFLDNTNKSPIQEFTQATVKNHRRTVKQQYGYEWSVEVMSSILVAYDLVVCATWRKTHKVQPFPSPFLSFPLLSQFW